MTRPATLAAILMPLAVALPAYNPPPSAIAEYIRTRSNPDELAVWFHAGDSCDLSREEVDGEIEALSNSCQSFET